MMATAQEEDAQAARAECHQVVEALTGARVEQRRLQDRLAAQAQDLAGLRAAADAAWRRVAVLEAENRRQREALEHAQGAQEAPAPARHHRHRHHHHHHQQQQQAGPPSAADANNNSHSRPARLQDLIAMLVHRADAAQREKLLQILARLRDREEGIEVGGPPDGATPASAGAGQPPSSAQVIGGITRSAAQAWLAADASEGSSTGSCCQQAEGLRQHAGGGAAGGRRSSHRESLSDAASSTAPMGTAAADDGDDGDARDESPHVLSSAGRLVPAAGRAQPAAHARMGSLRRSGPGAAWGSSAAGRESSASPPRKMKQQQQQHPFLSPPRPTAADAAAAASAALGRHKASSKALAQAAAAAAARDQVEWGASDDESGC